jgi:hypothetical protein
MKIKKILKMLEEKSKKVIFIFFLFLLFTFIIIVVDNDINKDSSFLYITGFATKSSAFDEKSLVNSAFNKINTGAIEKSFNDNKDVVSLIVNEAKAQGVDPAFALALSFKESSFYTNSLRCEDSYESGRNGPYHINVKKLSCEKYNCDKLVSELKVDSRQKTRYNSYHQISCSYGLFQMMYTTAHQYGFRGSGDELINSETNVKEGVKHIKTLLNNHGKEIYALAAYNAGSTRSRRCEVHENFADFLNCLPAVTRDYIPNILAHTMVFENLLKGTKIETPEKYLPKLEQKFDVTMPSVAEVTSAEIDMNPNFDLNIPYRFIDYYTLKLESEKLLSLCSNSLNRELCISEYLFYLNYVYSNNDIRYEWKMEDECLTDLSRQDRYFQKLLSYIELCYDSESKNCYCDYKDLGINSIIGSLSLNDFYGNTKIIYIDGKDKKEHIILDKISQKDIALSSNIFLSKDSNGYLSLSSDNIEKCIMPQKKIYRFCVMSSQKMLMYDENKKKMSNSFVEYRFALTFHPTTKYSVAEVNDGITTFVTQDSKGNYIVTKLGEII